MFSLLKSWPLHIKGCEALSIRVGRNGGNFQVGYVQYKSHLFHYPMTFFSPFIFSIPNVFLFLIFILHQIHTYKYLLNVAFWSRKSNFNYTSSINKSLFLLKFIFYYQSRTAKNVTKNSRLCLF